MCVIVVSVLLYRNGGAMFTSGVDRESDGEIDLSKSLFLQDLTYERREGPCNILHLSAAVCVNVLTRAFCGRVKELTSGLG